MGYKIKMQLISPCRNCLIHQSKSLVKLLAYPALNTPTRLHIPHPSPHLKAKLKFYKSGCLCPGVQTAQGVVYVLAVDGWCLQTLSHEHFAEFGQAVRTFTYSLDVTQMCSCLQLLIKSLYIINYTFIHEIFQKQIKS